MESKIFKANFLRIVKFFLSLFPPSFLKHLDFLIFLEAFFYEKYQKDIIKTKVLKLLSISVFIIFLQKINNLFFTSFLNLLR